MGLLNILLTYFVEKDNPHLSKGSRENSETQHTRHIRPEALTSGERQWQPAGKTELNNKVERVA